MKIISQDTSLQLSTSETTVMLTMFTSIKANKPKASQVSIKTEFGAINIIVKNMIQIRVPDLDLDQMLISFSKAQHL